MLTVEPVELSSHVAAVGRDVEDKLTPLRVALVDHTATMGGGEVALLNLATAVDRTKVDLLVVLFAAGPLADRLQAAGVPVRICPLDPTVISVRKDTLGGGTLLRVRDGLRMLTFARRLAKIFREERVALVHTNSLKSDVIGGIAARLAGVPVIWHVRDRIAEDYLPRRVAALFRLGCRVVPNHIIANSDATRRTLARGREPDDGRSRWHLRSSSGGGQSWRCWQR